MSEATRGVVLRATIGVALVALVAGVVFVLRPGGPVTDGLAANPGDSGSEESVAERAKRLFEPLPPPQSTSPDEPRIKRQKCPPTREVGPLRVASFNIHGGVAGRSRFDLARIVEEIRAWKIDVVLVQEIHRYRARSGLLDMPAAMAEALEMQVVFGANFSRNPERSGAPRRESGTAVLSRFPVGEWTNTLLPNRPGLQQRGLLAVDINVDGIPVTIYNTHLDHQGRLARREQAKVVAARVAASDKPALVGGDFNAGPGKAPVNSMTAVSTDAWAAAGQGNGLTVPAANPRARIDFVFYRDHADSESSWTPRGTYVRASAVSDHRAVIADFTLTVPNDCPGGS